MENWMKRRSRDGDGSGYGSGDGAGYGSGDGGTEQ